MALFNFSSVFGTSIQRSTASKRRRHPKSMEQFAHLVGEELENRILLSGPNPNQIVDTMLTPTELAQLLVGSGVTVENATFSGGSASTGSINFTDPTVLGFGQGIVLSSGSAADVVGPNLADWTSTDFGLPGDTDLTTLSGFPTFDAAVLEFDFTPSANQVVFTYVFSSDEYPEWVNTPFNDVFAFYVNGTNYAEVRQIAGDPTSPFVPVAVNNINNGNPLYPDYTPQRPDLFRPNYFNPNGAPSVIDLELDGLTHVLTFQAPVNPGITNHMKLAIADASDGIYDSAVFIQGGSLVSNENPVADLSLFPLTGQAPLVVSAIIEGEDPNNAPLTYTIDWGDGTTSNGPLDMPMADSEKTALVNHTYTSNGSYFVTLTVSNGTAFGISIEDVDVGAVSATAPLVTSDPTDQAVLQGGLFAFSASATGVPAPTVQWQVSTDFGTTFVDIPGATDTIYTATASLADDGNQYRAVFSNSEGTATTAAANLIVSAEDLAPIVSNDPTDQVVTDGDQFSFSASATGVPAPTVQWQASTDFGATFFDIPGATDTTFMATASLTDDGNQYRAVFSNSAGSVTTAAAILTVSTDNVSPIVTINPMDQTVFESDLFTFIALATGIPVPTVQWQVSTDFGATFVDIPSATDTTYSDLATRDHNGNQFRAVFTNDEGFANTTTATLTVLPLDTTPPVAPGVALTIDSGSDSADKITNVGSLTLSGLEPNASVEFSVDNGVHWSNAFSASEGPNSILVRQTDLAGNIGASSALFGFWLDTTLPAAPSVALVTDSGADPSDKITNIGSLTLGDLEPGASIEYSINGGATWSPDFSPIEGVNSVMARQTDLAGNIGDGSAAFDYTLDTTLPTAPSVALATDSGVDSSDKITNVGSLTLDGLEPGGSIEYSVNGGTTWSPGFSPTEGVNSVMARQTDLAGNIGNDSAAFGYTLDTTLPTLAPSFSSTQPFLVGATGIVIFANATDAVGVAFVSTGAVDTSNAGRRFITCTATDFAGNVASVDVPYVVGYAIVNVTPLSGASFRRGAQIPVSFQLADANGLISDQTAMSLTPNISVAFDGLAVMGVKYNKKTKIFAVRLKTDKSPAGVYDIAIHVILNGADVSTIIIPITLV